MLRQQNSRISNPRIHTFSQICNRTLTFESLLPGKSPCQQPRNSSPKSIVIKPIESVFRRQPVPTANSSLLGDISHRPPQQLKRPHTVRVVNEEHDMNTFRKGLFQIELERSDKENIPVNMPWDLPHPKTVRLERRPTELKERSVNKPEPSQLIVINKKNPVKVRQQTEQSLLLSLSAEDFVNISEPSGMKEDLDMSPYFQ